MYKAENMEAMDQRPAARNPFIAERLVDFSGSQPAQLAYLNDVLTGFGNDEMYNPHITLLTAEHTSYIHRMRVKGPDIRPTRGLIESAIESAGLPEARHCSTGEAEVFGQGERRFVGFNLDVGGNKIIRSERSRVFRELGLKNNTVNHAPHISLARTEDPDYAAYVADCLNSVISTPLRVNMGPAILNRPPVFSLGRGMITGLPADSHLGGAINKNFGTGANAFKDPGVDLIMPKEGIVILDQSQKGFKGVESALLETTDELPEMQTGQITGTEIYEAKQAGKDVKVVALTMDDKFSKKRMDERRRLLDRAGIAGAPTGEDEGAARVNVAVVRSRKLGTKVEKMVRKLVPPGRQIFFGQAILRVYRTDFDYVV